MPFVRFLRTPHDAEAGPGHGFREGGVYEVSGRSLAYWRGIIPEAVEEVPSLPVAVTQAAAEPQRNAPPDVPVGPPEVELQPGLPMVGGPDVALPPPGDEPPVIGGVGDSDAPDESAAIGALDERAMLLAEAERRGIAVDGRWGLNRLRSALAPSE